jgi:hypothetical protein
MSKHESYREILSENAAGHHVYGSSLVVLGLLALALIAASF